MKLKLHNGLRAVYSLAAITLCLALAYFIHFVIGGLPPALYGLMILTLLLKLSVLKASYLEYTVQWIFRHMGVCFVPAGVGIIEHYNLVVRYGALMVSITFVTTILLLTFVGLWVSANEKSSTT